jgi:hypothetical protein
MFHVFPADEVSDAHAVERLKYEIFTYGALLDFARQHQSFPSWAEFGASLTAKISSLSPCWPLGNVRYDDPNIRYSDSELKRLHAYFELSKAMPSAFSMDFEKLVSACKKNADLAQALANFGSGADAMEDI